MGRGGLGGAAKPVSRFALQSEGAKGSEAFGFKIMPPFDGDHYFDINLSVFSFTTLRQASSSPSPHWTLTLSASILPASKLPTHLTTSFKAGPAASKALSRQRDHLDRSRTCDEISPHCDDGL